jgi:hypothetical protein
MSDSGKYLFYVPKKISLEAGDKIVCETARGKDQLGVCCCDSFLADPAVVCPLFGTQESVMKYVTGKVEYERFEIEKNEDEYEERFGEE